MRLTALFVVAKALQTDFAGRADHLSRRRALLTISSSTLVLPSAAVAADGGGFSQADAQAALEPSPEMLGGLKTGTGRSLNALIKMRSETGIERTGSFPNALVAPGQLLDEVFTATRRPASIAFSFPEAWRLDRGPNMDVRNVRESDSAFLLATPLPASVGGSVERLADDFFLDVLFDPAGKYGAYGKVEDRKVLSSSVQLINLPSGGTQPYRRIALKFAPLTYNGNVVERRALLSATAVGGTVFIMAAGSLATRYKKMEPELLAIQESFRAQGTRGSAGL